MHPLLMIALLNTLLHILTLKKILILSKQEAAIMRYIIRRFQIKGIIVVP